MIYLNMKKILSLIICLILIVCIFPTPCVKASTETQTVNFGKTGQLASSYYFSEFGMNVGAEFDLSGGIDWPIEVRMVTPDSIRPGQFGINGILMR